MISAPGSRTSRAQAARQRARLALEGAAGAKQVLMRHADEACAVPFPDGAEDVDTPQDYHRLCSAPH